MMNGKERIERKSDSLAL